MLSLLQSLKAKPENAADFTEVEKKFELKGGHLYDLYNNMINILYNYKKMLGGDNSLYLNISDVAQLDYEVEKNKKKMDENNLEDQRHALALINAEKNSTFDEVNRKTNEADANLLKITQDRQIEDNRIERYINIQKELKKTDIPRGGIASTIGFISKKKYDNLDLYKDA